MIELIVTLLIVGIIATTASVSYFKYANKARIAEASNIVDAIGKSQAMYYSAHKHFVPFYTPAANDGTNYDVSSRLLIPSGGKKYRVDSSASQFQEPYKTIWSDLGSPIGDGTMVSFLYAGGGGKTNSSGQFVSVVPGNVNNPLFTTSSGAGFIESIVGVIQDSPVFSGSGICNGMFHQTEPLGKYNSGTPANHFGADTNWIYITGAANFNNSQDNLDPLSTQQGTNRPACTFVTKYMETDATGKVVNAYLKVVNPGD